MIDFFKMGEADFWAASAMLSLEDFTYIWHPAFYAGLTDAYSVEFDYWEYCEGFAMAWEEHDAEIDSVEKPWLFEGFGATSREYIAL